MAVHEFTIEVTVQVDTDDPTTTETDCANAAVEAIRNAVEYGEDNGFLHALADEASVGVVDVGLQVEV